jgi:hypothetical protein
MLNVGGAKDDGAAHLAADPVLARFPQDRVLAHRKNRSGEITRHNVSRNPVGHQSARCGKPRRLARLARWRWKRARDGEAGGIQNNARFAHAPRGPQAKSGRQRGSMVVIIQPAARG